MRFFCALENWKLIEPYTSDPEFVRILQHDFDRFTFGRWGIHYPTPDRPLPGDWETFYQDDDGPWGGLEGEYRAYVRNLACHWLVGANLKLATLIIPNRPWRIVMSSLHSTVWDGDETLYDMTGQALYGCPNKAFAYACAGLSRILAPGEYLKVKPAPRDERRSYRRYVQQQIQQPLTNERRHHA